MAAQSNDAKAQNFVQRYSNAVVQLLNDVNVLSSLKAEWDAQGFAQGAAPVQGVDWNITDEQVQGVLPACNAAMLNTAVGAVETVRNTVRDNAGYLTVLKP